MLQELGRKAAWLQLVQRVQAALASDLFALLVVAGGVVLRLRQFQARLSFGNDEAALAQYIVHHSLGWLSHPADYRQAAPVLFLLIQKALILLFGNQDFILEIFPLLVSCAALFLFQRLARRQLGPAGLLAVIPMALSFWLVHYAANPKQYSVDVLVAVSLVWLAAACLREQAEPRGFIALGLAGAVSLWLSHPAAFVLGGIGLAIFADKLARRDRRGLVLTVGLGTLWVAAFAALYLISLRSMVSDAYLVRYWQGAFMPLPPWSNPRWFVDVLVSLVEVGVHRSDALTAAAWLSLVAIGTVSLLWRDRRLVFMLLFPFFAGLAAAALHKYPFTQRFLLFLLPAFYLLAAEGVRRLYVLASRFQRTSAVLACAVLLVLLLRPIAVSAKRNFFDPHWQWNMRPVVEYLLVHAQPQDTYFVSGGGETFAYYAESLHLATGPVTVNANHRIVRYYEYMKTLKKYAGQPRVWVVFAYFEGEGHQYQRYAKYLASVGQIEESYQYWYTRLYRVRFDPQ